MEQSFLFDEEGCELFTEVKAFIEDGEYSKALEILEDLVLAFKEDKEAYFLQAQQGIIFMKLAQRKTNPEDVVFTYTLASVECYSEDDRLAQICAKGLVDLADILGSVVYYRKCLKKAKLALSFSNIDELTRKSMETMIGVAESRIADPKRFSVKQPKVLEPEKRAEPETRDVMELRSYWVGLDVKIKRDFMKVSIDELTKFVKGTFNREGQDTLEEVLASAKKDRKWTFWMCRAICMMKFSSAEECKNHLEQHHAADFKPSSETLRVQRIGKDWARKISAGGWEPVDVEAAVEMIENRLEYVKDFASKSKNGWSEGWPLAVDEERSKLLQEIKSLLVSFCDLKILPCSIRDLVMFFPLEHLVKLQVSEQSIHDLRISEKPQSICFLERPELCQIRDFLKKLKCERKDGTDLVCKTVDSIVDRTGVREKIDFDKKLSYLLLDKRLLKSRNAPFDANVTINEYDPNDHYAKASVKGDDIISWLVDYSSVDKIFPRPIREHNIDIWVAVMKAVQFTCRTLKTKYAKKTKYLGYEEALTDVMRLCNVNGLCKSKDERSHASLLYDKCEQRVSSGNKNGHTIKSTKLFLCAVQDVLEGALDPTFDLPSLHNCLSLIRERKTLSDDLVLQNINLLKPVVTHKVLLIDSKILLIDNSRISLLNDLTRLSVFDNRTYMLRMLKPFMLDLIHMMASKAKSDAAEVAEEKLLLEEEKMSQTKEKISLSKKKKDKRNKRTSTSMPSPLDKTVEQAPSAANFEPEGTSPSLKTVEEESMELEATLASERGRLEISSHIDSEEAPTEVVHDMQNMPGEVSLSEQLESAPGGAATIYGSALDMTLKALLNIKLLEEYLKHNEQPSDDHREEQVTCALQKVVTAFKSGMLEGVYGVLLSDLLASLKDVISMSGGAAEVLVTILQFWPCWKDPEPESLVNRFFMLEENERMRCIKCRWEPNYSDQRSYGIVMAADSIRDLKSAFGNIKFVDILKMIRMENKMLCDTRHGGCGERNFVRHFICRNPPIFTIVLTWEKRDTEQEISETTKALEWEIDLSRIYEDLEPNTNYRLVSMVGCGEKDEHICLAYGNNRWVNVMRDSLTKEDVGNWEDAIKFCEDRKVRPEILFYEGVWASSVRF